MEQIATLFGSGRAEAAKEKEPEVEKPHAKIGQILVERDFWPRPSVVKQGSKADVH